MWSGTHLKLRGAHGKHERIRRGREEERREGFAGHESRWDDEMDDEPAGLSCVDTRVDTMVSDTW